MDSSRSHGSYSYTGYYLCLLLVWVCASFHVWLTDSTAGFIEIITVGAGLAFAVYVFILLPLVLILWACAFVLSDLTG